jgi:hypothetical protein
MMDQKFELNQNNKVLPLVMIAVGVAAVAIGFMSDPTRTWASLLINNFYFNAIALAGTFFVAVQLIAQSGWSVAVIRVPEAMGAFMKYGMLGMILIFVFGHHDLYHWTHPELYDKASPEYDAILAGKSGFLNIPFFMVRIIAYALIWVGFTFMIRKRSLEEDQLGGVDSYRRKVTLGAVFIVLFAVTSSTSAWDFLMSIDAHWFSTLFGWYTFAGLFVSGMAMMALLVLYLKSRGYMDHVNESHLHDVGKFMFAFSIFWTYLWFSQFMLIWYANLPEEVVYYQIRWIYFKKLWVANLLINFIAPFLVLMTRDAKRKTQVLWVAGFIIIGGHWLDVYLMVTPGTVGAHWHIGFVEIGTFIGYLGLFLFSTFRELSKAAIVPKNHPMLPESLEHHI